MEKEISHGFYRNGLTIGQSVDTRSQGVVNVNVPSAFGQNLPTSLDTNQPKFVPKGDQLRCQKKKFVLYNYTRNVYYLCGSRTEESRMSSEKRIGSYATAKKYGITP